MVPINMTTDRCRTFANSFGCRLESLPFTYLGLPMGTTKPSVSDLTPLISKIDKRLAGISNLLSHYSRVVVIKSVISAMPNHIMCAMKLHYTHIDHVNKSTRTFLWHGNEIEKKVNVWLSGTRFAFPKKEGGLGILNLRQHNKAMMIKNLYKFFICLDIPWVKLIWQAYYQNGSLQDCNTHKGSFWWRNCLSFLSDFKNMTTTVPGQGNNTMFWQDKWHDTELCNKFPELFSFAKKPKIRTKEAMQYQIAGELLNLFQLPLSLIAENQMNSLCIILQNSNVPGKDKWTFPWGGDRFCTKKVYDILIKAPNAPKPFEWI